MWFDGNFCIYLYGGDIGKLNKGRLSKLKNDLQFISQFNIKMMDAEHRYSIKGLPDTISERVVLQSLIWYGSVVFFDKNGNLMALPGVPSGDGFNVNGDVGSAWVFGRNGAFNEEVKIYLPGSDEDVFLAETNGYSSSKKYKGVMVWENYQRFPFMNQVMIFARAISDTMRTLDVCRANIKNPYIVVSEESVVPTVKEYFNKRDNNEEYIISSGIFPADKVKVLPLVTNSESLTGITSLIEWYEAKWRELCGVENNSQMDKKGENLIEAEVSVNDEYTSQSLDKVIKCIQEGLDDVNKIFGTNITVEKNAVDEEKEDSEDDKDKDVLTNNR